MLGALIIVCFILVVMAGMFWYGRRRLKRQQTTEAQKMIKELEDYLRTK